MSSSAGSLSHHGRCPRSDRTDSCRPCTAPIVLAGLYTHAIFKKRQARRDNAVFDGAGWRETREKELALVLPQLTCHRLSGRNPADIFIMRSILKTTSTGLVDNTSLHLERNMGCMLFPIFLRHTKSMYFTGDGNVHTFEYAVRQHGSIVTILNVYI